LDKTKIHKKRAPVFATRAEIDAAIEALSREDQTRLKKIAQYRFAGLGRRARGKDHEDLLHDAMVSIYRGAASPNEGRHWPKDDVPLIAFVAQGIRSVASHWAEADEHEPMLDSEMSIETGDGGLRSPIDGTASSLPSQERDAIAKEKLEGVLRLFESDNDASTIIEAWSLEMEGPEIVRQFNMSENRYEAGRKRIRYKVKA
jgi:hypothetical protein